MLSGLKNDPSALQPFVTYITTLNQESSDETGYRTEEADDVDVYSLVYSGSMISKPIRSRVCFMSYMLPSQSWGIGCR